jgi:hypothetical protein
MKQYMSSTVVMLVCASCAHDVTAHFPGNANPQPGEIEIALTATARNVHVAIDDNLIVTDAHSKHIVIDNVPAGPHRVRIAMGSDGFDGKEHEATVVVAAQARASLVVAAPTVAVAQAVLSGAVYVGEMIVLGALLLAIH